jgi:adenine-specific DNA methylase
MKKYEELIELVGEPFRTAIKKFAIENQAITKKKYNHITELIESVEWDDTAPTPTAWHLYYKSLGGTKSLLTVAFYHSPTCLREEKVFTNDFGHAQRIIENRYGEGVIKYIMNNEI